MHRPIASTHFGTVHQFSDVSMPQSAAILDRLASDSVKRILYIQTSLHAIGGSLIASGIAGGLAARFPQAQIDVIGRSPLPYEHTNIRHIPFNGFQLEGRGPDSSILSAEAIRDFVRGAAPYDLIVMLNKSSSDDIKGLAPLGITLSKSVSNYGELALEVSDQSQTKPEIVLLPQTNSIYQQSEYIAKALGISFAPTMSPSAEEQQLALQAMRYPRNKVVIYIHPGTSTESKELTKGQWEEVINQVKAQGMLLGLDFRKFFFAISPGDSPRHASLAAQIAISALTKLCNQDFDHLVILPKGNFGLLRGLVSVADGIWCADTVVGHMATKEQKPCTMHFSKEHIDPAPWKPHSKHIASLRIVRSDSARTNEISELATAMVATLEAASEHYKLKKAQS